MKFYCVGYTPMRYYMNGYQMGNLEGHKAKSIAVDLIATFLPDDVVDGLYKAVELAGLHVANLTLVCAPSSASCSSGLPCAKPTAIFPARTAASRYACPRAAAKFPSPAPNAAPSSLKKAKAIPHNSKCRYGERGAADAKPKAQIILDVLSSILATQMPCRSRRSGA